MERIELSFSSAHRAAAGHFPGHPIMPGAVLLSEVVLAIAERLNLHGPSCAIKSAKFFAHVRPGDLMVMEFSEAPPGEIGFRCEVAGQKVLSGVMRAVARAVPDPQEDHHR